MNTMLSSGVLGSSTRTLPSLLNLNTDSSAMSSRHLARLGHCSTSASSHSGFNPSRLHQSITIRAQALGSRDGDEADSKSVQRGSAAGPLRVFTPLREASAALANTLQGIATTSGLMSDPTKVNLKDIRRPVDADMEICRNNLVDVVGRRHPLLRAAADQIFSAGGKRIRPLIVLLVARATFPVTGLADINDRHRRLAEITEMIHTASLVHDDVLDECDIRRGKNPYNSSYFSLMWIIFYRKKEIRFFRHKMWLKIC